MNLAPVREFSVPELGTAKGAKKLYIALSQYMNLVVPKATLHPDTNSLEKTPKIHNAFVNRRRRYRYKSPNKNDGNIQPSESPPRQSESSSKIRNTENTGEHIVPPKERAGSADLPKPKPPSIIRLVATSHGDRDKNDQKLKNPQVPMPPGVLYVGSTVNKEPESAKPPLSKRHALNLYQMHGRRSKCCERLHEILSHSADDKRDDKKDLEKLQKKLDSHEKLHENLSKSDRFLPTPLKPLGVQGRNYKSEEQLTVIYRLQKEKMRRTNTIAEIQI